MLAVNSWRQTISTSLSQSQTVGDSLSLCIYIGYKISIKVIKCLCPQTASPLLAFTINILLRTGLLDMYDGEEYLYGAFKNQADEGSSKGSLCENFPRLPNADLEGSIFYFVPDTPNVHG